MHKILVIERFHDEGMRMLQARPDVVVEVVDGRSESEIAERIKDADGVTVRTATLPAAVLEQARRLKVLAQHGVGHDNIDLEALNRRGVPLAITADVGAVAVAEHTVFLLLAVAGQGIRNDRETRAGNWRIGALHDRLELSGKRLLVLGFGRTGREVALRLEAFGMEVMIHDPHVDPSAIGRAGYGHVEDFRAALPTIDVLSVHMPLTAATRHLIGAAELAALPASAIVINTARGAIVDEAALAEALRAGRLAGAGLDVFEREPPPEGHPLLGLENVVLSPHVAGVSRESAVRMGISTARNVLEGVHGALDPAMVVNPEVLRDAGARS